MVLKRLIISVIVFYTCINDLYSITLKESIGLFYQNSNSLKSEQMKVKEAQIALAGAVLDVVPGFDIRYSKTLYQRVVFTTVDNLVNDFNKNKARTTLEAQESFSVNSIVLDPVRAVQMSKVQKLSFRVSEQNLLLQAVVAYLNVIRDSQILQASIDNENVLTKYISLVKKRFELGEVTKTDLEQSRSRLSNAKSAKIQAEGGLSVSKAIFRNVFGVEPNSLEMPEIMPIIPNNFDEFEKLSDSGNLEIQLAEKSKSITGTDVARSVAGLLPSISASYSRVRNDDTLLATTPSIKEQKTYMINMSIPILPRGGAEYAKILQSKYIANRYSLDYEASKSNLKQQILESWTNLETSEASLKAAEFRLKYMALVVNAVKREAQYGSRTTLDVLNAELENFDANVNLIKAQYARIISYYKLIAIMGKLDKKVFGEVYKSE